MKTLCSFSLLDPSDGEEGRTGEVLERTDRGLFLASNTLYPPGTSLALLLALPGQRLPVRLRGEVEWARIADRAGMYIRLADAPTTAPTAERASPTTSEAPAKPRGPGLTS